MFEDEASFWLDGTQHQTWSRIGNQPRVNTYGLRKTAHFFGAVTLYQAESTCRFANVFNGETFHEFLKQLVAKYAPRKTFLIIDNGPRHWLDDDGRLGSGRAPTRSSCTACPPEFNPTEGAWKVTRKMATHDRFQLSTEELDCALVRTFRVFRRRPGLIATHVARFQCSSTQVKVFGAVRTMSRAGTSLLPFVPSPREARSHWCACAPDTWRTRSAKRPKKAPNRAGADQEVGDARRAVLPHSSTCNRCSQMSTAGERSPINRPSSNRIGMQEEKAPDTVCTPIDVTSPHKTEETHRMNTHAILSSLAPLLVGALTSGCGSATTSSVVTWEGASVNVKSAPYNAKGDDATNDTAAIQAALAEVATTGGIVYFPRGTYRFDQTLLPASGVHMIGEGGGDQYTTPATTLKRTTDVVGAKLLKAGASMERMLVTASSPGTADGIWIGVETDTSTNGACNAALRDVAVTHVGGNGIYIKNGNVGRLDNVRSNFNGGWGVVMNSTTANVQSWSITGLSTDANTLGGLIIGNASGHSIQGFDAEQNGGPGLQISGASSTVTGAWLESNATGENLYMASGSTGNTVHAIVWPAGGYKLESASNFLTIFDGS